MSVERAYYCEGPDCGSDMPDKHGEAQACHARTATPPPHLPSGFIETRQRENGEDWINHFCSWDCAMKFAAQQPVAEITPWNPDEDAA